MKILHCHSTFSLGGKEARAVRLMNLFGDRAEHSILSSVPDALGAREMIAPGIRVAFPGDQAPPLHGKPSLGRYRDLTRYMRQFDLVLSYNWGSMDAVGARRLFPSGCPPLIHHEDGFNADEAQKLNWKRNAYRRLMLPTAKALVVPSTRLEAIAAEVWKQPPAKLHRIPNGIDTAAYAAAPAPDALGDPVKQPGELWIGTLAGLRTVKNLPRLVRAFATLTGPARLVIVGEGPEREAILAEAARLGVVDKVHLPGFRDQPHRFIGLLDIFALSSDSEQFPISLVEAMAAGVPAASLDVGDVRAMIDPANLPFIAPDEAGLASGLQTLAADPDLRARIGAANRARAEAEFGEVAMVRRYAALYGMESPL